MYNFGVSSVRLASTADRPASPTPGLMTVSGGSEDFAPIHFPTGFHGSSSGVSPRRARLPSFSSPSPPGSPSTPLAADRGLEKKARENKLIAKKTSTLGNSFDLAALPSPPAPPPQVAATFAFAPIREQSSPRGEQQPKKGHSRSRSSDAKEKESQLARLRTNTDHAPAPNAVSKKNNNHETKSTKRGLFGKKKSVDLTAPDDGPALPPALPPLPLQLPSALSPFPSPSLPPPGPESSDPVSNRRPPPAFLDALDSSMMRRSSYYQLVDKGIVREWNDPPAPHPSVCADGVPALPPPIARGTSSPSTGRFRATSFPTGFGGGNVGSSPIVFPSSQEGGWHVDRGSAGDFVEGAYNALEDDQNSSPYFKIYFNGKEHANYWAVDSRVGPVLVSVAVTQSRASTKTAIDTVATFRRLLTTENSSSSRRMFGFGGGSNSNSSNVNDGRNIVVHRCLIQSKFGAKQVFVRSASDKDSLFKGLALACGPMGYLPEIQEMQFKKTHIDITDELLKMERSHFSFDYKFGVLYYKKGQSENEMFSNETSPEMERFLNFLGDRVTLKGWSHYTGGLDVKTDTTGTHSVFAHFRELNVMFHVCTLLPFFPKDPQQLERKRHIGNDIVVVVYVEPGAVFDPCMMKTQFNHIYAIVSVDPDDHTVRLEFAVKQGVRPFGPQLSAGQRFYLDANFRELFFSKLINSERAALKASVFAQKLEHTRKKMIESIVDRIQAKSK